VTFLFTDIEGSTRRWEADPDGMRAALAAHDAALRAAIEDNDGWLFKHTGDGVCAAFASARAAVEAAVTAQRTLRLPVRMGLATGEASERDGDYFGTVLNRAARIMGAGHGGQVLVEVLTAGLVDQLELVDLGEHRLRDLSGTTRLFQVQATGLRSDFPPLRTIDTVPGNLPVQTTSFVGRELEVHELVDLVRAHRLVTLTGVGGVGKTRLALEVATAVQAEFHDGAWLVELAQVGDPEAVPDVVATALGVRSGSSVIDSVVQALSGRHVLIVLDNCEHVLDAAATVVGTILARTATVKVIATSREGLAVASEHRWAVPPLDTMADTGSAAVTLFAERAKEVAAGFSLDDHSDASAVVEICRRLDGIALAIELAAARMVSMTPGEVLERLADRFRLLAGSRRGAERHQTLRQAVGWSFDLLGNDEYDLLCSCSVFADGFDLASAQEICGGAWDEYAVLDGLDSLVRKSLITAERVGDHTRYRMLETIRQYADDKLAGRGAEVRDRHARYFAATAVARWQSWDGPGQRAALDWVDVEFGNLRAGFRWSADRGDVDAATAIAAHTAFLGLSLQRYEAVGWAEELLATGVAASAAQLPRLYAAASLCSFLGRPGDALDYARSAVLSGAEAGRDPVAGWSRFYEAVALRFLGAVEGWMEVFTQMADQQGLERILGLSGVLYGLPNVGRTDEARLIADETLVAVRAYGNPWIIAFTMDGYARAYAEAEPGTALAMLRQGLDYAREHKLAFLEGFFIRDAAALEAWHGQFDEALDLFDRNIDSLHRAGDVAHLSSTLGYLVVLLERIEQPVAAATVYGTTTRQATLNRVSDLAVVVDRLRAALGPTRFDEYLAVGAAMDTSEAAHFARRQIRLVRQSTIASPSGIG
jgi:predicted ATPase